jgi:hypothetical protein
MINLQLLSRTYVDDRGKVPTHIFKIDVRKPLLLDIRPLDYPLRSNRVFLVVIIFKL